MMEYTKSPRKYVADLIDSIELRVIQLPAPAIFGITWIEPGTAGDSVTEVGTVSSTGDSSRTLDPFWPKWRHWIAYVQNWWGTRVAPFVPPDADLRDYLGKNHEYSSFAGPREFEICHMIVYEVECGIGIAQDASQLFHKMLASKDCTHDVHR